MPPGEETCQNDNSWEPGNVVEMLKCNPCNFTVYDCLSCCHISSAYVDHWDMLNNFCFHVYAQKSLFMIVCHAVMSCCHAVMSCCHMSSAYVDHWDMVNNFCFHVYAQKSLFIGENGNDFFTSSSPPDIT